MDDLIVTMFSGVETTVSGLGGAVKGMFLELLYEDPAATSPVISDFAKFSFLFMGVGLALGLGYFIIRKITSLS